MGPQPLTVVEILDASLKISQDPQTISIQTVEGAISCCFFFSLVGMQSETDKFYQIEYCIYLVAVVVNRGDRHQSPLSVFPMAHRALPNHRLWLVTWFKLRLLMDPSHVLLPPLRDCGQAGECLAGNGWQC